MRPRDRVSGVTSHPLSDDHPSAVPADLLRVPCGPFELELLVPRDMDEEPGERISFWFGLTCAAVALARQLAAGPRLDGQRTLELGCGLGLAGLAAGRKGAAVTFSDMMPQALRFARDNARRNGLRGARVLQLDWERPGALERYDLLLGAEVAYDYFHHDDLLAVLQRALAPGGRILLADRRRLAIDRFLGRLVGRGFACREIRERVRLQGLEQQVSVFSLRRAGDDIS